MEVGDTATDFEHRSFGEELTLCQRYFSSFTNTTGGNQYFGLLQAYNNNGVYGIIKDYPVTMRATPTVTQSGNFGGYNSTSNTWQSGNAIGNLAGTDVGWRTSGWTGGTNLTAGDAVVIFHSANAKLMADAEL